MKGDGSSLSKAHKFGSQYRNDIPDLLKKWPNREKSKQSWSTPIKEINENDYILSANAHNPNIGGEEEEHRSPSEILKDIAALKREEKQVFDKIEDILK